MVEIFTGIFSGAIPAILLMGIQVKEYH